MSEDELAPATSRPSDDDPEKIRADIERTRAQMNETIGAIQEKLRPEELKSQAAQQLHEVKEKLKEELREQIDELKDKVREEIREAKDKLREATVGKVENMVTTATDTVEQAGSSFLETVRANPIPAAMVGIGLGWLLMRRRPRALPRADVRYLERRGERLVDRHPSGSGNAPFTDFAGADEPRGYDEPGALSRLQERADEVAHRVQGAVGGAVQQVGDRAKDVAHRAQDAAHDVADRARGAAQRAQHAASDLAVRARGSAEDLAARSRDVVRQGQYHVQDTYDTNPLALGAVALLAGVAVGLALPRTQREDRLMGETRDKLIHRAQEVAHETIEKVQGVVNEKVVENGIHRELYANHASINGTGA